MIYIKQGETAGTRSCDFTKVSRDTLFDSSMQHISDVKQGMKFFEELMYYQAQQHDKDKLSNIDEFHSDFIGGFKNTTWWDNHIKINRHHLLKDDGVPEDVNLVDVIEMVVDCVMVGKARTGDVYPLEIKPEVLMKAFNNTFELIKNNVEVID